MMTPEPTHPTNPDGLANDVQDYLDYLAHERKCAANTLQAYGRVLAHFQAWAASGSLRCHRSPQSDELTAYLACLAAERKSPQTVAYFLKILRTFWRWLVARERTTSDAIFAVEALDLPKPWERVPLVLSVSQVQALLAAPALTDRTYLRVKAIMEVLYSTACRVSELTQLRLENLKLAEGKVQCRGKGDKERILYLGRAAVETVTAYLDVLRPRLARTRPETPWLFISRSGAPLTREYVYALIRDYGRRAGLSVRPTPHALRRSAATHMLQAGANIRVVQEILGHASIEATQRYVQLDATHLKEAHRRYHVRGGPHLAGTASPEGSSEAG
jgi:integrase/recombinase XerD